MLLLPRKTEKSLGATILPLLCLEIHLPNFILNSLGSQAATLALPPGWSSLTEEIRPVAIRQTRSIRTVQCTDIPVQPIQGAKFVKKLQRPTNQKMRGGTTTVCPLMVVGIFELL